MSRRGGRGVREGDEKGLIVSIFQGMAPGSIEQCA